MIMGSLRDTGHIILEQAVKLIINYLWIKIEK